MLAAHVARDLARIGVLLERHWAPYSKWLTTAFARLTLADQVGPQPRHALSARSGGNVKQRCAPGREHDGIVVTAHLSDKAGTRNPTGSAISPVLANLFMHYAFDLFLARNFPGVQFERYADDAIVHCASEQQARVVLAALTSRMAEVGLRIHPTRTKMVYCKDGRRRGSHEHTSFTFLGYTFRPRGARRADGTMFVGFQPRSVPRR
jgi:hypothetical protein